MAKLTKAQIISQLRTEATTLLNAIATRQAAYRNRPGKTHFFQVLPTHSSLPIDGTRVPPDRLNEKPAYQTESLTDLGLTFTDLPFRVSVDQYHSAKGGVGFLVSLEVEIEGKRHLFRFNHGPDTFLHSDSFVESTAQRA